MNNISYSDWKKEIQFWQIATNVKPDKQGAAIFLSLTGKSREAVLELTTTEISGENGVDKVLEKLDGLWKEDDTKQAFNAYESFEQFRRPAEMGVTDYLNAFDRLNNKLKVHNMELPQGVLAYRVLKSANLTTEQEQLAKATAKDVTYKSMCDKLKSIFGDSKSSIQMKPAIEIKPESPFYCDNEEESVYFNSSTSGYGQRGYGGRGRPTYRSRSGGRQMGHSLNRGRSNFIRHDDPSTRGGRGGQQKQQNPVDHRGQISRCTVCDSTYHWMRDCPNRPAFTMFTSSEIQECYISKLVGESFAGGLLDCGCTKTVCGAEWYKDYVRNLSDSDMKEVQTKMSNMPYKFGDGKVVYSHQRVTLPVYIGDHKGTMDTEVVDQEIPLLISKEAMRKAGVILNFSKDTAIFHGKID